MSETSTKSLAERIAEKHGLYHSTCPCGNDDCGFKIPDTNAVAALNEMRDEAMEAAAQIADDYDFEGTQCADRIRALKGKP